MTNRQRWNQTSLPNKLNIILAAVIAFMTLVNVGFFVKQVLDQDRQVDDIKTAITEGIRTAKTAIDFSLTQQNAGMQTILKQNRDAIDSAAVQAKDYATESNRINRESIERTSAQRQATLDASVAASQLSQRAWVSVKEMNAEGLVLDKENTDISVTFVNSGSTPALDYRVVLIAEEVTPARGKAPSLKYSEADAKSLTAFGPATESSVHLVTVYTKTQLTSIRSGRIDFYIAGSAWYSDIFKIQHKTDFCAIYSATEKAMIGCGFHNTAD